MNRHGSDKPHVCHNALQTSLIREQIKRRISSTIHFEIPKSAAKVRKKCRITKQIRKITHNMRRFHLKINRNPRMGIKSTAGGHDHTKRYRGISHCHNFAAIRHRTTSHSEDEVCLGFPCQLLPLLHLLQRWIRHDAAKVRHRLAFIRLFLCLIVLLCSWCKITQKTRNYSDNNFGSSFTFCRKS